MNPKSSTTVCITIPGPYPLEGLLTIPANKPVGIALICHPHPLHLGTMHNKVVTTLAKAAEKCGYMSLRFNFRGVGKSQGSYGEGIGELIDAQAALDYLQEAFRNNHDHKDDATQSPLLVLMGFSFGGYIAAQLCSMPTHTTPDALITIAPALHYEHLQLTQAPLCPWLVVHGEADEVISYAYNQKWLQEKAPHAQWIPFSDTGHFFHGKLIELQSTVQDFLSAWK